MRIDQQINIITCLVNVLSVIYTHFYFCTYSNSLKDIGRLLEVKWTDDASAIQSIVWRIRWQRSRDDHWKNKILTYNIEDCLALMRVTRFIDAAVAGVPGDQPFPHPEASGAKVTLVEDIDRARAMSRWGLNKFVLPDFQFISRCSYFDYQREHVTTVDKHGLRHEFLEAHEPEVAAFGDSLAHRSFSSDAAETLRERLLKSWRRLFTFIHHDGVSWNNNDAENAIRYFAYYREKGFLWLLCRTPNRARG